MNDTLISEVRELRREVVASAGGNIDELGRQLRQIQEEFETRSGRFAGIPRKPAAELFPQMNKPPANFVVNDVRSGA